MMTVQYAEFVAKVWKLNDERNKCLAEMAEKDKKQFGSVDDPNQE